jgi:uncharacterized membrane protein (DUF441 family)
VIVFVSVVVVFLFEKGLEIMNDDPSAVDVLYLKGFLSFCFSLLV